MNKSNGKICFPQKIRALEKFSDRFDAFKLQAKDCDVLFAMYPAGTSIEPHKHETENHGVITKGTLYLTVNGKESRYDAGDWYCVAANQVHSARFEEDSEEIEFWFYK